MPNASMPLTALLSYHLLYTNISSDDSLTPDWESEPTDLAHSTDSGFYTNPASQNSLYRGRPTRCISNVSSYYPLEFNKPKALVWR